MTQDQWLRSIPYVIGGCAMFAFASAMFVHAWRKGERPYAPPWPWLWNTLTGVFFLSIVSVAFTNVTRIFADFSVKTEHRMAYGALWFWAVMSVWMFARWWREPADV